ncbi:MAG: hypothetical protein ACXWWC_12910 [Chitinophagaceae bacterium]
MNNRKIIFVYNANSNLFSMVTDYVHKAIAPSTYNCKLCALTFTNFGMKKQWKKFIETLDGEKIFLYKDDFIKKFPDHSNIILPAILLEKNRTLNVLLTTTELNSYHSLDELQNALTQKLNKA